MLTQSKPHLPRQQCPSPAFHHQSARTLTIALSSRKAAKQAKKEASKQKAGSPAESSPSSSQPASSPVATATSSPATSPSSNLPSTSSPASNSSPVRRPQARQETPQVVVDRIFSRMVWCAFLPVLFGIVLLVGFYFLKKHFGDDFPLWPAYVSQTICFGGGLLGISYGALSASWDPNRPGSWNGWTEFQANLPIMLELTKKDKR
uniref:Protein PAM68, chloroplastic n=1 Tax=Dunaliella tertiolecta TaxID=3047 RepID=A0A7S3RA87_DUNTE